MKKFMDKKFINEALITIIGTIVIGGIGYIYFWLIGEIISHI